MNLVHYMRLFSGCLFGSEKRRYESRYHVLSALAKVFSFRLYNKNLMWFHDNEYLSVWRGFAESDNNIHERKFNLFNLARTVKNIAGDTVECGVYRGASSFLIIQANKGAGKPHHIFDSFEGLSAPEKLDHVKDAKTFSWHKNDLAVPESVVRENLSQFSNVHYYKGWIPTRFSAVENLKFSFVHIDVDLYQPTFDSVEFFYPKMTPGGIIVCDDYGFESCPGAYKAVNDYMHDKPESVIHLTTGQGVIIKQ